MREKIELLTSMHNIVKSLNNENAYMTWIYLIPNQPTDDDFVDIAEDKELFELAIKLFREIIQKYLTDGFFINNCLYKTKS